MHKEPSPAVRTGRSLSRANLAARVVLFAALLAAVVLGPWEMRGNALGEPQAAATATVLGLLGFEVTRAGNVVRQGDFAMRVEPVCDGLDFALILALAMLVSPVPVRSRVLGVGMALVLSQALNLVRLVCMSLVGVYFRQGFDVIHQLVWQVAAIVVAVAVYSIWLDRADE